MNDQSFARTLFVGSLLALMTSLVTIAPFLLRLRSV